MNAVPVMKKSRGKTIWAVFAGVLFIVIASTLVDQIFHATGVYPDNHLTDGLAVLSSSYRLIIGIAGAYLTAKLAPDRPLRHALILGYVGTVLGLIGVVTTWNLGLGPRWYPISLAVLAIPQCWLGGWLYEMRLRPRPA
jgi:hypothetical protein